MPLARAKLLPHAVARFHAAHPEVQIDIVDGQQAGLTEQLREGDLDFLVGALPYSSPGKGIEQKWLFDDPLVVIARADHPLVDGGNTLPPWQELARSEEHTSEIQSLMRISHAVFCLKK